MTREYASDMADELNQAGDRVRPRGAFTIAFRLGDDEDAESAWVTAGIRRESDGKWYGFESGQFADDQRMTSMEPGRFPDFFLELVLRDFEAGWYTAWFTFGDAHKGPRTQAYSFQIVQFWQPIAGARWNEKSRLN